MTLRPATEADFAFIRALASHPDYAPFITDEDEAALGQYLSDPSCAQLIWEPGDGPKGFAIFCGIGQPSGSVELLRLALASTGSGQGRRFLRVLMDHAFTALQAERLWLDASSENLRAQAVYARAGFTLEGRLRRHWYRPALGQVVDLLLYGILKSEWEALDPPAAQA